MKTSLLVLGTAALLAPVLTASAQSPAPSPTPAATPAASPGPSASPAKHHHHRQDATPAPGGSPGVSPSPGASPSASSHEQRRAAQEQRLAAMTPAPGGGPNMVWVNTKRHVYHMPTSKYYGKTKEGKYMTEDAAKAEGDHAAPHNE